MYWLIDSCTYSCRGAHPATRHGRTLVRTVIALASGDDAVLLLADNWMDAWKRVRRALEHRGVTRNDIIPFILRCRNGAECQTPLGAQALHRRSLEMVRAERLCTLAVSALRKAGSPHDPVEISTVLRKVAKRFSPPAEVPPPSSLETVGGGGLAAPDLDILPGDPTAIDGGVRAPPASML